MQQLPNNPERLVSFYTWKLFSYNKQLNNSSNINEVIRPVLNFLFFFYDKISQVQKSIKTQVQFFIKCRLEVDLVLYACMYLST